MQPYTYRIGWSKNDVWYYGAQYGKTAHPDNLWKTYFTSSKYVKAYRLLYGEPDVIEIRKIFLTAKEAKIWETKVLTRLRVLDKENWLNRTISSGYPIAIRGVATRGNGWRHSEATKKKISQTNKMRFAKSGPCTTSRKQKLKEWTGARRYNYNHTIYQFVNLKTKESFCGTFDNFCKTYQLSKGNVSRLLQKKSKSVKGWVVIEDTKE